jgi:hypothetical protein
MSSWLRQLALAALVCTATATCREAHGGFLAPELADTSAAATTVDATDATPAPLDDREIPTRSLDKLAGMAAPPAPSSFASNGSPSACDCDWLLRLTAPASERLWLGIEEASPSLDFLSEILRPPRV